METPRTISMNNFEVSTLIRENRNMQQEIYDMEKKICELISKQSANVILTSIDPKELKCK